MRMKGSLSSGRAWRWLLGLVLMMGTAGGAWGQALPEGKGKEVVEEHCTVCHGTANFTGSRFSRQDWEFVVNDMIDRGALIDEDDAKIIVDYLTEQFGPVEKSKGEAKSTGGYGKKARPETGVMKSLIRF